MKKRLTGVVVSDKMNQTVVVQVDVVKEHPLYGKKYRARKKFSVDNPENKAQLGQQVEFEECRPISKTKKWRIVSIMEAA